MASNEFNERCEQYALYLPSLQKAFAKGAYSSTPKNRAMPKDVTLKQLDFLNPKNKLWHYKYALYSVGQFKVGEQQTDIVTNRNKDTIILGDSGGFQIGKGTLAGYTALKNVKSADEVCRIWSNDTTIKSWIVNWLETHSDYAMTLDMPLWAQLPSNKASPFHKCSTKQLIDLSIQNLEFINVHKRGNTKWLNVIQGTNEKDTIEWWKAVNKYRFNGWALAGGVGWRGGAKAILEQICIMREEGAFEKGLDWIHVLGVSQPKWAVILTAIQNVLRLECNENLRISYDSASPNIQSGKFQSVAVMPNYTNKADTWGIRAVVCPNDKVYVGDKNQFQFPFASALGDKMYLNHLNVTYDAYSNVHFDEISYHLLTHHNTWIYVNAMLKANQLAFLDRHDAMHFVPIQLLDCLDAVRDVLTSDNWRKKLVKNEALFESIKSLRDNDKLY